jgi:hypothetical protein
MCCGFTYKTKILKGFYNSAVADLDTYVHSPAVYDRVIECPSCGYSTDKIGAEVNREVMEFVYSDDYQKIAKDESLSNVYKKNYLSGLIYEYKRDYKNAAQYYLHAFWITREESKSCTDLLNKVINSLKQYLDSNMDIPAAIMMIDCMRQISSFEEAEETATSLKSYLQNEYDKKLIDFELVLIRQRDNKPHSQREVES